MKLTLRYTGELTSNGGPAEQHSIRKILHIQLVRYWETDSRLREIYKNIKSLQVAALGPHSRFDVSRPIIGIEKFFWRYPLAGYNFVPLTPGIRECHCHLSIRLYRSMADDSIIFNGGDIDNRLKTFFDGLQVPQKAENVPVNASAGRNPDDWPATMCLLDNDRSITKLFIESIRLLTPIPENCKRPQNYVEMDIDIEVVPVIPMSGSLDLLFP
jgi:hypothetical protein